MRKEFIKDIFMEPEYREHSMEHCGIRREVHFVNDSRSTNVNNLWFALESIETRVILIMGGIDKGNDYTPVRDLIKRKVAGIVVLGQGYEKIMKNFADMYQTVPAENMNQAVSLAHLLANKGDTVLLSPACASFDLFENYEDRGRQFKEAVRKL